MSDNLEKKNDEHETLVPMDDPAITGEETADPTLPPATPRPLHNHDYAKNDGPATSEGYKDTMNGPVIVPNK